MTTERPGQAGSEVASTTTAPVLGEGFKQEYSPVAGARGASSGTQDPTAQAKLLKKNQHLRGGNGEESTADMTSAAAVEPVAATVPGLRSASPLGIQRRSSPKPMPASPGRVQSSPRVSSPASSQIFERSVQEDVATATSPAIPSHIATENHIPPVLESASKAITDDDLDPDAVEIITHLAHQPASVVVAGASTTDLPLTPLHHTISAVSESGPTHSQSQDSSSVTSPVTVPPSLAQSMHLAGRASPPVGDLGASAGPASEDGSSSFGGPTYGSLDSNDVRRLSFISFADVVHAEHITGGGDSGSLRDSLLASPNPTSAASPTGNMAGAGARSPSPMRSPVSPSLSAASGAGSTGAAAAQFADIEGSPARPIPLAVGLGVGGDGGGLHGLHGTSPPTNGAVATGELAIETMGQALRNTTSGDLSAMRSSVVLSEDGDVERR